MKKYDGTGFRTTGDNTYVESPYHMRNLVPKEWGTWPPLKERIAKNPVVSVICPDVRTAVVFNLEAFDLDDKGYSSNYFRRQMAILKRIVAKPGIEVDKILDEFPDKFEREVIYPPLHKVMIEVLTEGLEAMGYVELKDGKATATNRGMAKLEDFKASLSAEERKALKYD